MNKIMDKLKILWTKFKSIKHIEIYCGILCVIFIFVVYINCFSTTKKNKEIINENSEQTFSSTLEYVDYLENKLCNVLSKISGVDDVDVIITLESGFGYEYVTEEETKTSTNGSTSTTITTTTVVMVSNEPLVNQEIYPKIKGVVVVAKGAEDAGLKLKILSAIQTVLNVSNSNITILSGS
ncbi:MAG: hypothetical protein IJ008_05140 [Clostridia bacterium]|nr:hypothetical protein [Clostridia bacterium]